MKSNPELKETISRLITQVQKKNQRIALLEKLLRERKVEVPCESE